MIRQMSVHLSLASVLLTASLLHAQENYPVHPDTLPQEGVPKGDVKGPFTWKSDIFPGTVRDYWIYVPAQYDADKPACVMIVQDGLNRAKGWKLITSLDNLIHKKEVPVTIGIFITPGVVPALDDDAQARFNRSYEYDAMGDQYARFLIDEILPAVGRDYNLSNDPNDRCIAGASSGAICAFNAAWERPDAFRRVLSTIGTYVSLRGANEFPTLVRKMEPKPIRVFLQDGRNDLDIYGGSWWVANQDMLSSLTWAGYDVKHAWGEGGHSGKHAAAIMPDILRWLWRDYPAPIKPPVTPERRTNILIPGEDWQQVSEGHRFTEGPAVNEKGEIFFTDIPENRIFKIDVDGKVSEFAKETGNANGLMFGSDGLLYACANAKKQIVAYSPDGGVKVVADGVNSNDLVIGKQHTFFTDPTNNRVYRLDSNGKAEIVDTGISFPNGVVMSPDQSLLFVAESRGRFVYSFQIQKDGKLAYKQPFFHLHVPSTQTNSSADGMAVDTEGRLYVTTRMGIQVCDQPGRVHLIIAKPQRSSISNVIFAGPEFDTLYATCGDKVFKRKIKATGARYTAPSKPPKPRL